MATISRPVSTGPATVPARRNGWLAWLSVILLIVGVGAGFFVGRVTKADTVLPSDLAGPSVTKMLDGFMAAVNAGDTTKIQSFFATDATFTDTTKVDGYTLEGNATIAQVMTSWQMEGFRLTEPGTAIQEGDFVAQPHVSSVAPVMAVYQLKDGKFQNVWIMRP